MAPWKSFCTFSLIYQKRIAHMVGSVCFSVSSPLLWYTNKLLRKWLVLCLSPLYIYVRILLYPWIAVSLVARYSEVGIAMFFLPLSSFNMYSRDLRLPSIYISCQLSRRNQTQTLPPRYVKGGVHLLSCGQILSSILCHIWCCVISFCCIVWISVPCDYFSSS